MKTKNVKMDEASKNFFFLDSQIHYIRSMAKNSCKPYDIFTFIAVAAYTIDTEFKKENLFRKKN